MLFAANLEELRNQEEDERQNFHVHLEELKEKKQEKLELVDKEDKSFTELKRTVASDAISSRSGKPLMPRVSISVSGSVDDIVLVYINHPVNLCFPDYFLHEPILLFPWAICNP